MMSIKPETLEFLKKLKNNNNRDWFEKNRTKFEAAKTDFEDFIQELINQLAKVNPLIKGQLAKNSVFRIYRDVRFSKNKEPYKLNFGAYICEGGKKSDRPGYYIQIQPGNGSFSAGGCWMPDTAKLKAIRQEIQYHPDDFKKIISHKAFIKAFGSLSDIRLKTVPKGFSKDEPALEYLKYTSYIVEHKHSDKGVLSKSFIKENVEIYKAVQPLLMFLGRAIG